MGHEGWSEALSYLKRFGSVTVLNGHIHQVVQKVEGKCQLSHGDGDGVSAAYTGSCRRARADGGSSRQAGERAGCDEGEGGSGEESPGGRRLDAGGDGLMRVWTVAVVVVASVAGLGFVHPFGNPRAEPAEGLSTLMKGAKMPADAKAVLVTKCADCHSSETRWPMYARVAPGSWLIERDIVEARKKMDLSRWEEMPAETQELWAAKIVQESKKGDMPPLQYLALHWDAKLSESDVKALSMLGKSASVSEAALPGGGDAVRGKAVFEKRCTGCHAMDADRDGPRLAGVFGRKAGSVPGFNYSAGLKNSGITWTDATLERWLSDPDMVVKDNNMSIGFPKAEERRDLIAYLKQ